MEYVKIPVPVFRQFLLVNLWVQLRRLERKKKREGFAIWPDPSSPLYGMTESKLRPIIIGKDK